MMIAFQVRSLLERAKVLPSVALSEINVVYHPATESTPLERALDDLDSMYDWDVGEIKVLSTMHLCNQIIHYRYMFARSAKPKQFSDLVLVSDYKMKLGIFKVQVDDLVELFSKFAAKDSGIDRDGVAYRISWHEQSGEYVREIIEDEHLS